MPNIKHGFVSSYFVVYFVCKPGSVYIIRILAAFTYRNRKRVTCFVYYTNVDSRVENVEDSLECAVHIKSAKD